MNYIKNQGEKVMKIDINRVKIFVTIPINSLDEVRNSLYESKAGIIGNYTCCTCTTNCIGTFKPNDKANPYIGDNNKINYVNEAKLEIICNISDVKEIIEKIRKVHPYEEPAIDIIPLIDEEIFK